MYYTSIFQASGLSSFVQGTFNFCLCVLFLQAVRESVQASTDDSVLKCLIDLADTCPKLLRANLEPILDLMLEVQCVVLNIVVRYFILGFIG